jgi:hypothetical protein
MIDEHSAPTASWLDALGTTVSVACAIQCAVFPFIIGVLPLVAGLFVAHMFSFLPGPSIILFGVGLFLISLVLPRSVRI